MDDLSRFCCLNSQCPEHGKCGAGNPTVTSRYGPEKSRRTPRCHACEARFSERKGTPIFDSRLPPEKVESVLGHIAEGCGVRQAGRLRKVDRGTVGRLSRIAGDHSHDLHDELVADPPTREARLDEKWSSVAKKEKNCDESDPTDDRGGDTRDHVAIDAEGRLTVSVVPGGRTAGGVVAVVEDFRRRTGGRLTGLITADGYPAYGEATLRAYGETTRPPRAGKEGRPKAPVQGRPAGPDLCRGGEGAREGPCGIDRHEGGLRHDGGGDRGARDVEGEPGDRHVVRGASERHGPPSQRGGRPARHTGSARTGGTTSR